MYRFLCLILLASTVHATEAAQSIETSSLNAANQVGDQSNLEDEDAYTDLERSIVSLSGLLSLSEQVKSSAQHMIALSEAASSDVESDSITEDKIVISHGQHFGIAQSLAKEWQPIVWENRLLDIIDDIDEPTQVLIEKSLSKKLIKSAQKKEKAAIVKQDEAEYQLYMNKLKKRPPAASRWQLVEALDKQSGFSQLIIQVRAKVYGEMQKQVEGWQPPVAWKKAAKQEVLEFLFYAYRKTPNGDLKKIAKSYNDPSLKLFINKVIAGL